MDLSGFMGEIITTTHNQWIGKHFQCESEIAINFLSIKHFKEPLHGETVNRIIALCNPIYLGAGKCLYPNLRNFIPTRQTIVTDKCESTFTILLMSTCICVNVYE